VVIKKLEVYVETSVWNFLRAEDVPERRAITEKFFAKSDEYDLFISPLILREFNREPNEIRTRLIALIDTYKPEIFNDEPTVYLLADEYVARGIFPPKYREDALHVAFASFFGVNVLLSWNFKHIVKYKVRTEAKATNIILGYSTPEIISPEEIIEYD
jgi:hypothetical protein